MHNYSGGTKKVNAIFIIVILLVIISIGVDIICNAHESTYIITITDKERIAEGSNSKYLVFGNDDNGNVLVFENTDTFWRFKWNSSNIQGELILGNRYQITVVGFRVPLFSMYENIIAVTLIE